MLQRTCATWHVTPDTWHLTHDTWHLTPDTWPLKCDTWWGVNIVSEFHLPSCNGLGFMMFSRSGGKGSVTDPLNDGCVCRTAPATPGLLITAEKYTKLAVAWLCLCSCLELLISSFLSPLGVGRLDLLVVQDFLLLLCFCGVDLFAPWLQGVSVVCVLSSVWILAPH